MRPSGDVCSVQLCEGAESVLCVGPPVAVVTLTLAAVDAIERGRGGGAGIRG